VLKVKPYVKEFIIPSVLVSIVELGKLVEELKSLLPTSGIHGLEISFKRTNGREVTASAVSDIEATDTLTPSIIANPSISVHRKDSDGETTHSIHLHNRIVPIQGGTAPLPYTLSLESLDATWIGHSATVLAWLNSRKAWYSPLRFWLWCTVILGVAIATVRASYDATASHGQFDFGRSVDFIVFLDIFFVLDSQRGSHPSVLHYRSTPAA
jgi:hypothetical protein